MSRLRNTFSIVSESTQKVTTEQKWSLVWLGWGMYFSVAEYIAIRSGNYDAPLSHHLRRALGIRRKPWHQRVGQVALCAGAVWLVDHLYRESSND